MVSERVAELDITDVVTRLNPCFNGIWSLRRIDLSNPMLHRLNPCFNGIWSLRAQEISGEVHENGS